MHDLAAGAHIRQALLRARRQDSPFRHWLPRDILPATLWPAVLSLPFTPPSTGETGPLSGIRRSLIVNYVGPEWRARHELAYPDVPVTTLSAR